MTKRAGYQCKVAFGSNKVSAIGTWSLDGITADQMDTSEFGNNYKTFVFGMKDGGTLSFSGFYDPDDTQGQALLRLANMNNTNLTSIRIYIDNTSYFEPCQTAGFFQSGTLSSGQQTIASWVNITSYNVKADKAGMLSTDFTAKISGMMVLAN